MTAIALIATSISSTAAVASRGDGHGARARGHSHGFLLASQLNRGLRSTPMHGTGFALVVEGKRRDVNPALIAGIAGTESTYGEAACYGNPYNAFGLASCGGGWVPYFHSWREAIRFMARFLRSHWPSSQTPYDLHGYAACDSCWADHVAGHMRELGFAASTRYPR